MPARASWTLCLALAAAALAAWLAPAASAAPGDQLWRAVWPNPAVPGYEIRSFPVLARGPGGDLWVAATGMDGVTRDRNYVLLRYSPAGALRWKLETGSPNQGHDYVQDLAVGADRSAVLTGYIAGSQSRIWTIKISPKGKRLWARTLASSVPGGQAMANAVAVDSHGNAYVAGYRHRLGRGADVLLAMYSPGGTLRWVRQLSGPAGGDDYAADVAVDASGNVFIAGAVQTLDRGKAILVARFSKAGALVWQRTWNRDQSGDDDVANALGVSRRGVAVAGGSGSVYIDDYGVVLMAKRAMRPSDKLRSRATTVPGFDLSWASVAINGDGKIVAGGTASGSTKEFAFATWPWSGSSETLEHYAPLSGWATCAKVWLVGDKLYAMGDLSASGTSGVHLASRGEPPHTWAATTSDGGSGTSLAAAADGVYAAGWIGDNVVLWKYEP